MADNNPHVSSELSRDMNLFHVTMMGLGMMIGAGVFIGIGNTLNLAGPGGLLLAFSLNGLLAIFTAMSFAELSSAIPRAGGAYNFARVAFGRGTSFLAGWMEWFASSVAGSLYAVVFSTYTVNFFVQLGYLDLAPTHLLILQKVVAFSVASIFIYINLRGSSETGKVGAFFTLGQMLFVVGIAILGIFTAIKDPSRIQNFKPFLPYQWSNLLVTMGFIYVAFEGFEVIAQAGDETINPRQNIPKAMLYSVFIVTLTYVAVSFATVVSVRSDNPILGGMAPWKWIGSYGDTGFGQAVAMLMPSKFIGNLVVTLAVIFSSTSALNATIFSGTRASYALGRDRMLSPAFARISKKYKTPWVALSATGLIVVTVAVCLPTTHVASSASIMFIALFFMVNLCVIKIRRNLGDELQYGYLMPLFPLFPILAIIAQVVLAVWLVHMSLIAWIVAPVWIITGIAIYQCYSKSRATTAEHEIVVLEEEVAAAPHQGTRVMVSVANPRNAVQLVRNTYKVCDAKNAHVELLHMVPVPEQVPLADADKYMSAGKEGIMEAMLYLENFFTINTTLRYCRNIARGIVSAVRQKKVDTLILGWHGKPHHKLFSLGSTIDPIIERSPCNVIIFKDCGDKDFKNVLVPVAGGRNSLFALEIASILVDKEVGEMTALTIDTGRKPFDANEFIKSNIDLFHIPANRIHVKNVESQHIADTIIKEAEEYDLVVLGTTREPLIYQISRNTVPERVAQECDKPLVVVKASGGIRSWLKRWF